MGHHKLRRLMKYSMLVDFLMKTRKGFVRAFNRHRESLHGIDGEAMFIGTILHSLDHTLAERNLEDPLWLDTESEEYGVMAELGRFSQGGVCRGPTWPVVSHPVQGLTTPILP